MSLKCDVVTVTAPVSYRKWNTPNFATLHIPGREISKANEPEPPSVPIASIPDAAFHQLVEAWVNEIYKKAGKRQPLVAVSGYAA